MKRFIFTLVIPILIFLGLSQKPNYLEPVVAYRTGPIVRGVPVISYMPINRKQLGATAFRPSEFKTTLAQSFAQGHSQTTLAVNSITTRDTAANTLTAATLGPTIVLHINPGQGNAEIVKCTGLTASTKTFTGCTFGYRFDTSGTSSSNILAHSPGETVIISNDDLYETTVYPQSADTATITGVWNFSTGSSTLMTLGATNATYNKRIYVNGTGGHKGWIGYDAAAGKWYISNDNVNSYDPQTGGSGVTAGNGIVITGGAVTVSTSTLSGLFFSPHSGTRKLSVETDPGTGLIIDNDNLLKVATTSAFLWTGSQRFTGSLIINNATSTITHLNIPDGATATTLVIGSGQPGAAHATGGLWNSGTSTTTGTVSVGKLCFAGAKCVSDVSNAMATSTVSGLGSSGTTETTVETYTLPANSIGPNGVLEIHAAGSHAANTNNLTVNVKYGATTFCAPIFAVNASWNVDCIIVQQNTNQQTAYTKAMTGTVVATADDTTGAIDSTADQTIVITLTQATAGTSYLNEFYVTLIKK